MQNLFSMLSLILTHPLNKKRKFHAFLNFIKWQIGIRLIQSSVIVPWVEESCFICSKGETGLTGNIYTGLLEFEDMAFLLHALTSSEVFVDVGANAGAYTILAGKVIKARCIAFEPIPETVSRFERQILLNEIAPLVDVRAMGIGSSIGKLRFTINNDTTNKVSLQYEDDDESRLFHVTTLDQELPPCSPYFLKIDVEGFEYEVLEGSANLLASGNILAIIIELNRNGEKFGHENNDVHEKLVGYGYLPFKYDPFSRQLKKLVSYNRKSSNTIYIKDPVAIANRCKSAPKRIVHGMGSTFI